MTPHKAIHAPARSIRAGVFALGLALVVACGEPATPSSAPDAPLSARLLSGPTVRAVGTVQDGGLPHAACSCVRCAAARNDPSRRRRVASLALLLPPKPEIFLLDATPDIREQLAALSDVRPGPGDRVDRAPLEGVLLTHAHLGHYTGLGFFGYEAVHTTGLPVYCSAAMAAFLRSNAPWSQLVDLGNVALREVVPDKPFDLSPDVAVTSVLVPHRDEFADTVGYLLQGPRASLLYVPDTQSWSAWRVPLTAVLDGVDIAILDGSFYSADELPGRDIATIGHPLITDSMDLLEPLVRAGSLRVYFTHLNHSNPALDPLSPERIAIEARGFAILEEGQQFDL